MHYYFSRSLMYVTIEHSMSLTLVMGMRRRQGLYTVGVVGDLYGICKWGLVRAQPFIHKSKVGIVV